MKPSQLLLIDLLKKNGYSITTPRLLVFETLYIYGLQTIGQLIKRCTPIDRASIYRSVQLLENLGAVNRIPQGFKYKLELSEIFLPHHHHIVCTQCGRHADVEQAKLEDLLMQIADHEGYRLISHKVELSGLCPVCAEE
jgi:Fe2+ or Zn2+ uptake regulation protein